MSQGGLREDGMGSSSNANVNSSPFQTEIETPYISAALKTSLLHAHPLSSNAASINNPGTSFGDVSSSMDPPNSANAFHQPALNSRDPFSHASNAASFHNTRTSFSNVSSHMVPSNSAAAFHQSAPNTEVPFFEPNNAAGFYAQSNPPTGNTDLGLRVQEQSVQPGPPTVISHQDAQAIDAQVPVVADDDLAILSEPFMHDIPSSQEFLDWYNGDDAGDFAQAGEKPSQ